MKQFLKRFALIMAMVSSLAVLQGCTEAASKQGESDPLEISQGEESEREDQSDAEPEPVPAIPPEEDEDLIREVLLLYGAICEEPDESRMRTRKLSLYFVDEWAEPEELPPGAYFSWFLTTVWEEKLTDQELEERYTLPDREGWAFPQEIYEARVQSRFDVSAGHLRSDETLYHEEEGVYWLGSGGGIGARPFVELQSVRRTEDLLLFELILEYEEELMQDEAWRLTVRLEENGDWKYRSWARTDHTEKEAEEETERLTGGEEQARPEGEGQAEAERIAAEETAAEEQTRQQAEAAAQQQTAAEPTMAESGEPTSGYGYDSAQYYRAVWDESMGGWRYTNEYGLSYLIYPSGESVILSANEPTHGPGYDMAQVYNAVWDPNQAGWLYTIDTGMLVLIHPDGNKRYMS